LNICIFSRAFYPSVGGLERIAQILATVATETGHKVEVVTDTAGIADVDDQQFPFTITRTNELRQRIQAFKRAEVVLFMNVSLHGMRAAIAADTPVVFSHHGVYCGRGLVGLFLEWLKRQLTWFYPNISVSQFVAHNIPAVSVVIPNAYDNFLFKQPVKPARECDFVFCGRLVSDKGADVCVQAFSQVQKSLPHATLTIVGDGPERQSLQGLAQRLGITAQVKFAGILSGQNLVAELQRHACMVVPSLWEEPFGIVALEGVACCDTVIVSRRGGLPEAVGGCGLVVEPTDDEMATAMLSVAQARRAGETLPGQPSEEMRSAHLARHTPKVVTRQYLNVIQQVISRQTNRGDR
jgi:glycosyltransferase involved in cell wall biosynthesis